MSSTHWMHRSNSALFTDLYQLTMLQAYFREGMNDEAIFDLFVRRIPDRSYLIACGLDTALDYLENLHFPEEAIEHLAAQPQFHDDFLQYLRDFQFTGDVFAVREGTPIFPDEPILEVVAPIGEAQLAETFLLNQITFQTGIASKASRVVEAARSSHVADFAMRRMHGTDAALKGARAAYIAGIDSTSNVLAGKKYGIPVSGTMAHSYIEAHPNEMDAFEKFSGLYEDTTLLIDTYDTVAGAKKVIELAKRLGDRFTVAAVRLDSGDMTDLAHKVRSLFDEAGLTDVNIFASGGLDEHRIKEMLDHNAPIDGFGVGTRMGTMADHPYLDSAFKLSSYAGQPRMKLAPDKSNLPGRKQLFRVEEEGQYARDVIATEDEQIADAEPLLELVMKRGARTENGKRSVQEARQKVSESISKLPDYLSLSINSERTYPVELSQKLRERRDQTRSRLENQVEG